MAEIDHLDRETLETTIARIEQSGMDIDLTWVRCENDACRARILYRLQPDGKTPAFRLQIVDVATGRVVEQALEVRPEEELWLAYRFGKLELTKKEVRIRARSGERAAIFLKSVKRPPLEAYSLAELLERK